MQLLITFSCCRFVFVSLHSEYERVILYCTKDKGGFIDMKVLAIFGAAMLLVGVYMIFAGLSMKRKNEIGTMILAEEEVKKCRDKKGFIAFMYWREMIVGGAIILLGVAEIANDLLENAGIVPYIGVIVGITALLWFFYSLKKARELFLQ